jgi:DNA-binding NarL/FixJ family response regulator
MVVDSSRMNGQAISAALKNHQFQVVYAGCNAAEAAAEAGRQPVDVALIGENLDGHHGAGFELTEKMRSTRGRPQVVMILDHSDGDSVTRAFRAGARGIFSRNSSLETLPKCIVCVSQGQLWASSAELEHLLEALKMPLRLVNASGAELLSKREREVVQQVSEGLTNREIADLLGLSENTIKNYIYRIFDKLGISSRVELVLYAASQFMQRNSQCQHCQNPLDNPGQESTMFNWYCKAVERFTLFQYLLGELYREGRGVPPDPKAAYMWFRIAEKLSVAMKDRSHEAQVELERQLTERQLADAAQEATNWVRRQQHLCCPKLRENNPLVA